jgi:hypothetical protein
MFLGFLPALCRVHQDVLSVEIDPHGSHLRRPVRHHRRQVTYGGLLEQLLDAFPHLACHRSSSLFRLSGRDPSPPAE